MLQKCPHTGLQELLECLTLKKPRYRQVSFDFKELNFCVSHGWCFFLERVWMILWAKAMGQHQLLAANDSSFFAAEGKLHRKSRVENASCIFTRI